MGKEEYETVDHNNPNLEGEVRLPTKTSYRQQFERSRIREIVFTLVVLLLGGILGALIILHSQAQRSPTLLQLLDNVPIQYKEFTYSDEYYLKDEVGDRAWDEMMPTGGGYVRVPNPRQYNLPPSRPTNDADQSEIYQASSVHQLHCLAILRKVIIIYERGESLEDHENEGPLTFKHCFHCLDTIRQAILCTGDVSLVFGSPVGRKWHYNGVGTIHKCRDWEVTKGILALAEYRFNNYSGPLIGT